MAYIMTLLIAIIIYLAVRLFLLRREVTRIEISLAEQNKGIGKRIVTVATRYKPLENLCKEMNIGLELRDQERIRTENHEAELRAQISHLSHDLRTPLTAILGYISMMRYAPEKANGCLDIIENRSKALQSLIEQFYELSVLDDTDWILESVDITALLTNCLLVHYTLFEEKGIPLESHLPERAVMIPGNVQALERIFQNLIQNALKFAQQRIVISLSDKGVFSIANDAKNLRDTDMAHLFERFYTADPSRSSGNTGLGLYIVKRLLAKTRGSVSRVDLTDGWFTLEIFFPIQK